MKVGNLVQRNHHIHPSLQTGPADAVGLIIGWDHSGGGPYAMVRWSKAIRPTRLIEGHKPSHLKVIS